MEEADGTADVYPPYPADWDVSSEQLEVFGTLNTKWKCFLYVVYF